jgi:hypothetical protein
MYGGSKDDHKCCHTSDSGGADGDEPKERAYRIIITISRFSQEIPNKKQTA